MTELSPEAQAMIAAARDGLAPDAEALARGRARLVAATTTAGAAVAASRTGLAAKATVVGLGVVGLAVVAAVWWPRPRPSRPAPPPEATVVAPSPAPPDPRPPAPGPAAAAPAVDPAVDLDDIVLDSPARPPRPASLRPTVGAARPPVAAPAPAPQVAPEPPAAPPAVDDPLGRELRHLHGARAALRAGDPGRARRALEAYAAEFPDGQLAEEAASLTVEARCAAGDRAGAAAARAAFVARWPGSTARARVERLCR